MTDDWDFYFLNVDDKIASMFVDLGAHRSAPNRDLPYMAYLRLFMNMPRADGLSSQEEFDAIKLVEDSIKEKLVDKGTDYVGRCTTNARRDFFFYVAKPEDWVPRVEQCMRSFTAYRYEADTREDKDWSTYFSYLYPSDSDWRTIRNRRVCEALEENGDKLVEAREIDHWAYFADSENMRAYVADAVQLGFSVRELSTSDADGARHVARVWRADVPSYDAIDNITFPLFNLAIKHAGEYDGWESVIVC